MRYLLLLRGINVGGKNMVPMIELKNHLTNLKFKNTHSYINSGNLFFESTLNKETIKKLLTELFNSQYPFVKTFVLISQKEFEDELNHLPNWWQDSLARKDVLFYSDEVTKDKLVETIKELPLSDSEKVHFGDLAIYWGKVDESGFLKTAYHKYLIKLPFYRQITIRNDKTFEKIKELLLEK